MYKYLSDKISEFKFKGAKNLLGEAHLFRTLRRTGGVGAHQVAVGFSDDDVGNVKAVSDYIRRELASRFGCCKFVVYDTSDPELVSGRKVTVSGQLDLPGF